MTTKTVLYNAALRHIGERKLSSVTEATEPRYVLDDAYTTLIDFLLMQGFWKFSLRTSQLTYDSAVTVTFGYPKAIAKPTDFIRTHKLCSDEYLKTPVLEYNEDNGYWYAHEEDIYMSYVSNGASYGADLTAWTPSFNKYAELYLATQIAKRLAPSVDLNALQRDTSIALAEALGKDAMEGPTEFLPRGGWSNSRSNGSRSTRDRGSRSNLTG